MNILQDFHFFEIFFFSIQAPSLSTSPFSTAEYEYNKPVAIPSTLRVLVLLWRPPCESIADSAQRLWQARAAHFKYELLCEFYELCQWDYFTVFKTLWGA